MFVRTAALLVSVFICGALSACVSPTSRPFENGNVQVMQPEFQALRDDHESVGWAEALERMHQLSREDQLQAVQEFVDRMPYFPTSYEWASPREVAEHGGVCKDHALAKYEMLRELGWPENDMRVINLHLAGYQMRNFGVSTLYEEHAVVVVRFAGHDYVLDVLSPVVLRDRWLYPGITTYTGQPTIVGRRVGQWDGKKYYSPALY